MNLTSEEKKVRDLLIRVAQGRVKTHKLGAISYKELWERVSKKKWGRGRKSKIVGWITRVSAYDLKQKRPPLNELVVVKGQEEPGESWNSIRSYLRSTFRVRAPYDSHQEAQEACWRHWGRKVEKVSRQKQEDQAEEGYRQDRTVTFRKRNAALIVNRKERDNYTCQACGFHLKVNGKFIIDCHHTNPLGLESEVTVTRLEHLVCLCPNCHRIAHTRQYPLSVAEIQSVR